MPTPYDPDKLADATLALLGAFEFDDGRAWKGYDFEVMARLHAEGMISNPHNRNASVHLTPEGLTRAKALADAWFGASSPESARSPVLQGGEVERRLAQRAVGLVDEFPVAWLTGFVYSIDHVHSSLPLPVAPQARHCVRLAPVRWRVPLGVEPGHRRTAAAEGGGREVGVRGPVEQDPCVRGQLE